MALAWHALCRLVREADEEACETLMEEELQGQARLHHLIRIHSRLNKVRADRERCELIVKAAERAVELGDEGVPE